MAENAGYTQVDSFVNSIIGEGTTLRGDFELNGLLRIDGKFYGRVNTSGKVLVGKNGIAESTIIAGTVVIGGKVKGDIIATERITLLSTGELIGNIKTPRLIIEEGVIFDGTCEIIEDKSKLFQIKEKYIEQLKNHDFYTEGHLIKDHRKREPSEKPLNFISEEKIPQKEGTQVT
jgi:cytoskeletal protein CcmA (bactofilin family)